jgi:pimeloyl-ACP methyl ester carboxylesterase
VEFLIALTLVVAAFGVATSMRTLRRRRVQTDYVRTEQQLRDYAETVLHAEHARLQTFASGERGRMRRDAAALLVQLRRLIELSGRTMPAPPLSQSMDAFGGIQANLERLQAGEPADFPRGTPFFRGYYSGMDGSLQPYSVCTPTDYDPARSYPLIITVDGAAYRDLADLPEAPVYGGAISIQPGWSRSPGCRQRALQEMLALRRAVAESYSVDDARVCLVGRRAGMGLALEAAARHPDLFAGLLLAGGGDACIASDGQGQGTPDEDWTPVTALRFCRQNRCPVQWIQNLQHTAAVILQGSGAPAALLEASRTLAARMASLGSRSEYLELPLTHQKPFPTWAEQYGIGKLLGSPTGTRPSSITYSTDRLRHNGAWWLHIEQFDRPLRTAAVRANVDGDMLRITTDNALAMSLLLDDMPSRVSRIDIDGTQLHMPTGQPDGALSLLRRGRAWRIAGLPDGGKRRGLSGPFADVMLDPFIVVYGTQGQDKLHEKLCRTEADRFAAQWKVACGRPPRMRADVEVTAQEKRLFNLLLIGGPEVNALSAEVFPGLPLRLADGSIEVGDRDYKGKDLGVLMCYPNPNQTDRMLAIVAGTTPAALYQAYDRLGSMHCWFDYAVFDSRTIGAETCVATGVFDNQWGMGPQGSASWRSRPAERSHLVAQHFPPLVAAGEASEATVQISYVRPSRIDHPGGAVAFDRTLTGQRIRVLGKKYSTGLGVRAPSDLAFDLDESFRMFRSIVALEEGTTDGNGDPAPKVVFEVWGDGELLASAVGQAVDTGGDEPTVVQADVRDINTMTLRTRLTQGAGDQTATCVWAQPSLER